VDIDDDYLARPPSRRHVSSPGGGWEDRTENEHVYVQTRLRRAAAFKAKKNGA
jgi:hypothetical protein